MIFRIIHRCFSISGKDWLRRHNKGAWILVNKSAYIFTTCLDVFVKMAAGTDLRSRAAFKLTEIQDKYRIISPSDVVVGTILHLIHIMIMLLLQIWARHLEGGQWQSVK
jgi:hypothetical protein